MNEDALLRKILIGDLYYAKLLARLRRPSGRVVGQDAVLPARARVPRQRGRAALSRDLAHLARVPRGAPVRGARPPRHGCVFRAVLAQGGEFVPRRGRGACADWPGGATGGIAE